MPSTFRELFDQGLVTARDPSLLREGEVSRADNCIYYPNDPDLYKAPGRTAYGTVLATSVASVTLTGTSMTKTNGFGTDVTSGTTAGDATVTSSAAFTSDMVGMRVYGTEVDSPTYVRSFTSTSSIELSRPANATNASATLTFSIHEPGDFVKGTNTAANTTIASVTNASTVVLDTAATTNGSDSVVIAPPIKALAFLSFPGTTKDVLLAYAGSKIYSSAYSGATGTFTAFITGLSNVGDESMEAIKAGNNYILLSTRNAPRIVLYEDVSGTDTLSSRLAGLRPVETLTIERQTSGQWPSTLGANYYYFLVTECVDPGEAGEAEGTFSGDPVVGQITDASTQSFIIRHPVTYNDGVDGLTPTATHWRVYMSPGQSAAEPIPALHLFRRVATVSIDQTSVTLSDSNAITPNVSGNATDNTSPTASPAWLNQAGLVGTEAQMSGTNSPAFTTGASTMRFVYAAGGTTPIPKIGMPVYGQNLAAGTTITSVTVVTPGVSWDIGLSEPTTGSGSGTYYVGPQPSVADGKVAYDNGVAGASVNVKSFGFRNDASNQYNGKTVIGVAVRINYKWDNLSGSDNSGNDRGFNISLYTGGSLVGTKYNVGHKSGDGSTPTFGGNRWGAIEVGGPGDTWGRTWSSGLADFLDSATFKVNITKAASAETIVHWIDSVEVRVYFTGVDVNLDGEAFPTVIYTDQIGEQVTVGAAGPPPASDSGDIFEGQALYNDTNNPSLIWGSVPDEYEKVPTFYQINISSAFFTPILVIRRVSSIALAFCRNAIKRLNYFPTEADANAQRGRAWEDIATETGVVSKRGVTLFDFPGRGPTGAFISPSGLMLTDGITVWPGNVDLDWDNTVETSLLNKCHLATYPQLHLLAFYYVPTGGTYPTKCMYFCYHPSHLKQGNQLAAVGPCDVRAASSVRTNLGNVTKLLTGNLSDGKVYLEDSGATSADTLVTILPTIRSRLIYPSDVGGQARVERLWLRVGGHGNDTTGVFTVTVYRQNIGESLTSLESKSGSTSTDSISGHRLVRVDPDNVAESFMVEITKADLAAGFSLAYLYALGEGYGREKSLA